MRIQPTTNRLLLVMLISFSGFSAFSQQDFTGKVIDAQGLPLDGVTIFIKGTNRATTTDTAGFFHLSAKSGDVLLFSFVGYAPKEITLTQEANIHLALYASVNDLNTVVVTGYMSEKVNEITGSVSVLKSRDLTEVPAGQAEQMLQGKVAGLNVITTGAPGSASIVRINGIGNFGDVTPLYIIDGIQGNINSINPYDIESLTVLKDAGAYSIYGVRGANGVIVVTTRKGRAGKAAINFSSYVGYQQPLSKEPDLLSPQEYGNLIWLAAKNLNQPASDPLYGNGPAPVMPDYYLDAGPNANQGLFAGDPLVDPSLYTITDSPIYKIEPFNKKGTDWFHQVYQPAWTQNYGLSVSGGNDRSHYLFSLGYLNQQGTLVNTFLKRLTARINMDIAVKKWIRLGENIQISYIQNPKATATTATQTANYVPVFDIMGNYSGPSPAGNPLSELVVAKDNRYNNWGVFGNVFGEINFLRNFTFKSSIGGNFNYNYSYFYNYGSYYPSGQTFTENSGYGSAWTWTNTLIYSKKLGNRQTITALLGTEQINSYTRSEGGTRNGYLISDPNYRFLSTGSVTNQNNYSDATTSFLSSLFAKIDYGYDEKYFLSFTIRRDASSIFGPQSRDGWFPAVGASWILSQEKFLSSSTWLSELKLRASWGKTGFSGNTDPLNQFTLYGGGPGTTAYDINGYSISAAPGYRTVRIGNPQTGWEKDEASNVGFESILWNGKLSLTADYYFKQSTGLLFQLALPDIVGSGIRPNANVGNVQNRGVNITLGSRGHFSKEWGWDANTVFTTYNNKITQLNDIPYFDNEFSVYGGVARNAVGHPMGSFFGYQILGYFQDAADVAKSPQQQDASPGRFKYLDANHDGHISANDSDMVFMGNPNPKFTLGINLAVSYKGFDLSTFLYGSFGNDVENNYKNLLNIFPAAFFYPATSAKSKTALYGSWGQTNNPKAPIQESISNFSTNGVPNSYSLEKGSYFRDKSLMLGYSFSQSLSRKLNIDRFRIYVQVLNLFAITHYSGLDPELTGNSQAWGYDNGDNYPNNQKQYIIGINLDF
jgi:TonB-dependent starch-binding outer membrane protein SusC